MLCRASISNYGKMCAFGWERGRVGRESKKGRATAAGESFPVPRRTSPGSQSRWTHWQSWLPAAYCCPGAQPCGGATAAAPHSKHSATTFVKSNRGGKHSEQPASIAIGEAAGECAMGSTMGEWMGWSLPKHATSRHLSSLIPLRCASKWRLTDISGM